MANLGKTRLEIAVLCATAALAAVVVATEHVYYFPLTPLSLDLEGRTNLPAAPRHVRLLYVGDIKLADSAASVIRRRGYGYIFGATRQLIAAADLAVGNLEGPITERGRRNTSKRWSYKVPKEAAAGLARAGFDLMNLANNHMRDCGNIGVRDSIRHLKKASIEPFGAGGDEEEAHRPTIHEVRGVRIAHLGYVPPLMRLRGKKVSLRGLCWGRSRAGAAWGSPAKVRRDIADARARTGADLVVVSFHMGDRYQRMPEPFERSFCHQAIDAGADAVIGHGTHIMGPIETYRSRPIFYSVGNFAFGSLNVRARFSLAAVLEVGEESGRIESAYAIPLYTTNANPWVWHQTKVLTARQGKEVLRKLRARSKTLGTRLEIRKDPLRVVVRLVPPARKLSAH
jgi:poly-gamma-glutamate synthesis protein (capsule biosynthesis protein)